MLIFLANLQVCPCPANQNSQQNGIERARFAVKAEIKGELHFLQVKSLL